MASETETTVVQYKLTSLYFLKFFFFDAIFKGLRLKPIFRSLRCSWRCFWPLRCHWRCFQPFQRPACVEIWPLLSTNLTTLETKCDQIFCLYWGQIWRALDVVLTLVLNTQVIWGHLNKTTDLYWLSCFYPSLFFHCRIWAETFEQMKFFSFSCHHVYNFQRTPLTVIRNRNFQQ